MNEDTIYKRDTYINNNIPFIFNSEITEYDMKSAAFSIIKEFKLLDKSKIEKLSKLEKEKRNKQIGIYQRDDEAFKETLKLGFIEARRRFFEANSLNINDLLSIKKDAIFTKKKCKYQEFGEILFRPKNTYTSYIYLKTERKSVELYYNYEVLDVKGISDTKLDLHREYMLKFLNKYFNKMETDNVSSTLSWFMRFLTKYKNKELEVGYYRTFDDRSIIEMDDVDTMTFVFENETSDNIDIRYNYFNILLKLAKISV